MEQQALATTPPPKLEDLAIDAVLHMGAALDVLDLLARHKVTAINCVCRDLLRIYYVKADQAQSLEPEDRELVGLLHDTAVNLGYAIEVVEHLNGDEADDPILYAVSYLLRAAKRFADEGCRWRWPEERNRRGWPAGMAGARQKMGKKKRAPC